MRHTCISSKLQRAGGFSLIELMVSLAIGLVISVAALSAYLGASGASKMAEAQSRMNEDGQAALLILTQQIRMAGSYPKHPDDNTFSIRGCDGGFTNINPLTISELVCEGSSTTTAADSVVVSYEADALNTVRTASGIPTDCVGSELSFDPATHPDYYVADNRFYIELKNNKYSLYCKGNGVSSTAQPLVENIEDIQFKYGVVSATNPIDIIKTATIAGYLNAYEFAMQPSFVALEDDSKRWERVITVRICVLVRSENSVVTDAVSAKYHNCEGTLVSAPDLRLRRSFETTVVLRNRRLK